MASDHEWSAREAEARALLGDDFERVQRVEDDDGEEGMQAELFLPEADRDRSTVVINGRCQVRREDEWRLVVVEGMPIAHFAAGDRAGAANAMVMLVERGWAEQVDVARGFGCSDRTIRRYERRYEEGGLAALAQAAGYPKGRPREPARDRVVGRLRAEGRSLREIGERIGVDESAVRKRLRRLGFRPSRSVQEELPLGGLPGPAAAAAPTGSALAVAADPNVSGPPAPTVESAAADGSAGADPNVSGHAQPAVAGDDLPLTMDDDPADRRWDRLLACFGLIDDAAPLFRDGTHVPGAGVLLAVPSLVESGVLDAARQVWGDIGPAFYGLRTTVVTLVLMALLRIKRPEALKERSPRDLGRVLGLDRAPEVKTVRRKFARLATGRAAETFGRLLAERRVARLGDTLGVLYIDGHVRVYSGQRRIPKTHAGRVHAVVAATTDYWVNDQRGDPVLVLTAQANAGLVKVLPDLLAKVRSAVGPRRTTIVFDRGGWSPKLFAWILGNQDFDILTYRKGSVRPVARRHFKEHKATLDGREVRYELADQTVFVGRGRHRMRLRQVTRLQGRHQTHVLTSVVALPAIEVAYRMFERWRQENFFKYLRDEFMLDALVDYKVEADDPNRDVPNPKWDAVDAKLRQVRAKIRDLHHQQGATEFLARLEGSERPKLPPGLKGDLFEACKRAVDLHHQRSRVPRRVPVGKITSGEVIKLATQRKHLTNVLKMVAYQAESDLVRDVAAHYRRTDDEGRTLVQTALASPADLHVTGDELRVTLAPLSSPHRSRAVAALCGQLNARATMFPGTRLRLRYAVAEAP